MGDQSIWPLLDRVDRIRETQIQAIGQLQQHGEALLKLHSGQEDLRKQLGTLHALIEKRSSGREENRISAFIFRYIVHISPLQWIMVVLMAISLVTGRDVVEWLKILSANLPKH